MNYYNTNTMPINIIASTGLFNPIKYLNIILSNYCILITVIILFVI